MTRSTPAKIFPLLLLFIFCATALANTLHKDIIYVSESSDNINSIKPSGEAYDYTEENANVNQVQGAPVPPSNLMGLLYYPGDACNKTQTSQVPSSIPNGLKNQLIALIQLSDSCSIYDQINAVQQQNAIGAIIIQSVSPSASSQTLDIKIPVFSISKDKGTELMNNITGAAETTSDGTKMVRVTMVPSSSSFGGGWQTAIIVIGAILAASFLVSVMVHCRLYQLRRRERNLMVSQHEANVNTKLTIFTLEKSVLKSFPTKVYDKEQNKTTVTSCAICIEELDDGETLRELPCSHFYHTECIDKWLTTKSVQCPLCKQDATPPEIAEKREKKYAHAIQVQDRLNNIYDIPNERRSTSESSRLTRMLEMFGYGGSARESQSRVRPTGGNLFSIQELPPVHNDNLNRIV